MAIPIVGLDPGASGGIALLYNLDASPAAFPWSDTEHDMARQLREMWEPGAVCYIERVHSMPKQGVASSFKFGRHYGFLRGLLVATGCRFEDVTPQAWQKALGCLSRGDKNVTKGKAQQFFPGMRITHAIADALLIAEYGRRMENRHAGTEDPDG